MKNTYVIGIDIGGTNFRIGLIDSKNQVFNFRKIRTVDVFQTEDTLADLSFYLKEYCQMMKAEGKEAVAVAIGFPATINRGRTAVLQAPNVAFMENLPVVERLRGELDIPVYIERDVNLALLYDQKKYELENCEILVGCYFGTGVGNAIMIDGKILTGKNGTVGELGHIPVDGSTLKCGCGNEGCIENLAGGKYLTYLCRDVYSDTTVENIFIEHGNEELLRRFVNWIAITIAIEVNILDPDCVLLGGGVLEMKSFPQKYLRERIIFHTRKPYPAQNLQMIFTKDVEEKCVIGAAMYARLRMREGLIEKQG